MSGYFLFVSSEIMCRCSPKTPTWSKESRFVLRCSPISPAWRTDLPVYRAKYPLQAGVFGLQAEKGSRTRFQVGKIGLQRRQETSEEGQAGRITGWRTGKCQRRDRKYRSRSRVNEYGAAKEFRYGPAFELMFLSRNKFKKTRFQITNIYRTPKPPQGGFLISEAISFAD